MENVKLSRALEALDAEFDKKTLDWLIGMYDGESGGFYYSQSSVDTDRFKPDIESTIQAISIMAKLGLYEIDETKRIAKMPEWFLDGVYKFISERQDEDDGYFYDPIYKDITGVRKKERNVASVINCFKGYIFKEPLYKTPMERISEKKRSRLSKRR